jgi:hypothetical protein
MNLDDTSAFARIDPQDMLAQIDGWPVHTAWWADLPTVDGSAR